MMISAPALTASPSPSGHGVLGGYHDIKTDGSLRGNLPGQHFLTNGAGVTSSDFRQNPAPLT